MDRLGRKISGFTLAEILISLGIIGIVAAMTLPTLFTSIQKRQTVAKLQKAISVISQAYKLSNDEVGDVTAEEAKTMGSKEYFKRYWAPYIKVGNYCNTYQECGYNTNSIKTLNLQGGMQIVGRTGVTFSTTDGTIYIVRTEVGTIDNTGTVKTARIAIDINGPKLPNQMGKDVFLVDRIMENQGSSIMPLGYNKPNSSIDSNCNSGTGEYCGEKIRRAGWKIDSTYPW